MKIDFSERELDFLVAVLHDYVPSSYELSSIVCKLEQVLLKGGD